MSALLTSPTTDLFINEVNCDLTVADAVWIGAALLHYHQTSSDEPLPTEAIVLIVQTARLTNGLEKSIYLHVNQHCVANRPPNSNRSRMLFETGRGKRRLFRAGDRYDPAREGAPTHPDWSNIPAKYVFLRRWYEEKWNGPDVVATHDPLLALIGLGAEIWKHEHADEYVANLRSNWGDTR